MTPRTQQELANMEVIRINGKTYMKEPFGPQAFKIVDDMDTAGKFVDTMQTTLMRKQEGKRFYI